MRVFEYAWVMPVVGYGRVVGCWGGGRQQAAGRYEQQDGERGGLAGVWAGTALLT